MQIAVPAQIPSMSSHSQPVSLRGLGRYLPERILTNDQMAELVDTNDEWIHSRTGIRRRRIAAEEQTTSDLATAAALSALDDAKLAATDIDLLIVATMSPDFPAPATAAVVQRKLGIPPVTAFDVAAACSGFIYGIDVAAAMLQSGRYRRALMIGAEKMSSIIDWKDRSTCVLFGDAASAVVLSAPGIDDVATPVFVDAITRADGKGVPLLYIPAGGSACPAGNNSVNNREHFMRMNGREIFKAAVREMARVTEELLERNDITIDQVSCVVPHQANVRIITSLASKLGISDDRVFVNIEDYGNTSAASIPLAMNEARDAGRFTPGTYILTVAFGAGLTWGAALFRW